MMRLQKLEKSVARAEWLCPDTLVCTFVLQVDSLQHSIKRNQCQCACLAYGKTVTRARDTAKYDENDVHLQLKRSVKHLNSTVGY